MEQADMRGVEIAFDRLQPIAPALDETDLDLLGGREAGLERRQCRRTRAVAHIDPDDAIALGCQISLGVDLVLEMLALRNIRHVEAVAVDIVFPAVIDAANAILFVAAVKERGATMRAALIHHADAARAIAKGDELLAEQQDP